MWILDSYDSEIEIERIASRGLIEILAGIPKTENIVELWVKPQWCKIDVTAIITVEAGKKYALFIEDKTASHEHNQLKEYNEHIKKITKREKIDERNVKKVFYKTNMILPDERQRIIDADWKEIAFKEINEFWRAFVNADHMVISQYAEHVTKICEDSKNADIPNDNNTIAWEAFFKNRLIPLFEEKYDCWDDATRFNYVYFGLRPPGRGNEKMPYLEIRSRDCLDGRFVAKIVTYEVDYTKNKDGLAIARNEVKKRENNGIFQGNYSEKHTKQIAHVFKDNLSYKNLSEFFENVEKCIAEYLEIISFWKF